MASLYHTDYLGERAKRNAQRQLDNHRAFMTSRHAWTADERAANLKELKRLTERLNYGSNFNNWG